MQGRDIHLVGWCRAVVMGKAYLYHGVFLSMIDNFFVLTHASAWMCCRRTSPPRVTCSPNLELTHFPSSVLERGIVDEGSGPIDATSFTWHVNYPAGACPPFESLLSMGELTVRW